MENVNEFHKYSKDIQNYYMILEQLYGIKNLDPKYLKPGSIEEAKQNIVKAYQGLKKFLVEDELEKFKNPLMDLIKIYENEKELERFNKELNNQ